MTMNSSRNKPQLREVDKGEKIWSETVVPICFNSLPPPTLPPTSQIYLRISIRPPLKSQHLLVSKQFWLCREI